MIIGVPKEIKPGEKRVALTPEGALMLASQGHEVQVENNAGLGCDFPDEQYVSAGATVLGSADEVWSDAELVLKVKEPLPEEYKYFREDLVLFTYLHLAANQTLAWELVDAGVTAIAYETVTAEDGSLPLLSPMSEVAGCVAVQKGAQCLECSSGGRGVLLPGVSGAPPAHVTVIGGGVVGTNACRVAVGMGAQVTVLDLSISRLEYLRDVFGGSLNTLFSNEGVLEECLAYSDLVIGAVLLPGRRPPRLITREMLDGMPRGSVLIDVAIDQGGIAETSRPTTFDDPSYVVSGVVHCCITNLPAAVPRSSTMALTACTIPYVMELADNGLENALEENPALMEGLNIRGGEIVHPVIREVCAGPEA